jgi:hypothetical protein
MSGLQEGAAGTVKTAITVRTGAPGSKARTITDFTNTALGREEM